MERTWTDSEIEGLRTVLVEFAGQRLGGADALLAEDLAHEVLVAVLEGGRLPRERHRRNAYLRQALSNRVVSHWKRVSCRREEPYGCEESGSKAQEPSLSIVDRKWLTEARSRLPFEEQAALFLRGQLGCGFETLGLVLGKRTEQAARRFHSRAVQRLVECVRRDLGIA
jgi:DNA-directed RNA polymerase specialized sigma24 family protein